jgi:hypothetical protein
MRYFTMGEISYSVAALRIAEYSMAASPKCCAVW